MQDLGQDDLHIPYHIRILDAQCAIAFSPEIRIPFRILILPRVMLGTVQFDNQLLLPAQKVGKEPTDGNLPAELVTA